MFFFAKHQMTLISDPLFARIITDCVYGLALGTIAFALMSPEDKVKPRRLQYCAVGGIVAFCAADLGYYYGAQTTCSNDYASAHVAWHPYSGFGMAK
jgi:drug/metabolite transporter (DMT)-like permease